RRNHAVHHEDIGADTILSGGTRTHLLLQPSLQLHTPTGAISAQFVKSLLSTLPVLDQPRLMAVYRTPWSFDLPVAEQPSKKSYRSAVPLLRCSGMLRRPYAWRRRTSRPSSHGQRGCSCGPALAVHLPRLRNRRRCCDMLWWPGGPGSIDVLRG